MPEDAFSIQGKGAVGGNGKVSGGGILNCILGRENYHQPGGAGGDRWAARALNPTVLGGGKSRSLGSFRELGEMLACVVV